METTERWLPVVGYEGFYEVSDHGRVRSLDRVIPITRAGYKPHGQIRRGRLLKITGSGRYADRVSLSREPEPRSTGYVHMLVLEAFIGPRPEGMWALHWDDDKRNNRLDNLRWGTPSDNNLDAVRNGRNHHANATHCPRGHEYTPENTWVRPSGGRRKCKACNREWEQEKRYAGVTSRKDL